MFHSVLNNILNIFENSSQETKVAKLSGYVMLLAKMYFYTLSNELCLFLLLIDKDKERGL